MLFVSYMAFNMIIVGFIVEKWCKKKEEDYPL